jgi:DNA-binding NarL/FixJ family response regulator
MNARTAQVRLVTASEAKPRRVVVVDDHATLAELLGEVLSQQPDLDCVGVANDLDAGLQLVEEQRPDLVVMDLRFAGDDRDGVVATDLIHSRFPNIQVVLLTGYADALVMQRAAAAGASSLMAKDGSLPDLLTALRTAGTGGLIVHPQLLMALVNRPRPGQAQGVSALSAREHDVLDLLAAGRDVREISRHLGISINTCRGYVKTLLRKLDAHSQLEAVAIARRRGLVDADEPT